MCGRFTLTLDADEIKDEFDITDFTESWNPRYNIAPTQKVLSINQAKQAAWMTWGINRAANDRYDIMINIRKETLVDKNYFKSMFAAQRCIIPMNGFFEWKKSKNKTQPFYFKMKDGRPAGFAGLWKAGAGENAMQECAIITCPANELVGKIHDRMPVILDKNLQRIWLGDKTPGEELLLLLQSYPSENMISYAVSPQVNKTTYNSPDGVLPSSTIGEQLGLNF